MTEGENEVVQIVKDLKQSIKDQAKKGTLSDEDVQMFDKKINTAIMSLTAEMIGNMGQYAATIPPPPPTASSEHNIIFTILDQHRTILKYLADNKKTSL
jgi:hypothetical protein